MSLFGDDSSPTSRVAARSALFDDDDGSAATAAPTTLKQSLFADSEIRQSSLPTADDASTSPWDMPTPRKAARDSRSLVNSLLSASEVPEAYIDLWDALIGSGDVVGGKLGAAGMRRMMGAATAAGLESEDVSRIERILGAGDVERGAFWVLCALIGLGQEREDVTLDGVDERRRNLPIPKMSGLPTTPSAPSRTAELASKPAQRPTTPPQPQQSARFSPTKTRNPQKDALVDETDPWGSPAMHQGHNHTTSNVSNASNGIIPIRDPIRTTSTFTTNSLEDTSNGSDDMPINAGPPQGDAPWGAYDRSGSESYMPSMGESTSFLANAPEQPVQPTPTRALGGGRGNGSNVEEVIQVTLLPEKEGFILKKHWNYQVTSTRRGSQVVRRYNDFVWLLSCLHIRYPFRQLPILPPKNNGLPDTAPFLEKRRRGLVRFVNALVRHPVLREEQLVTMFLTVPSNLQSWSKQACLSMEEEYAGKILPPGLEDSLPPTLEELFITSRAGIKRSEQLYIELCKAVDRLAKRAEGLANEHGRMAAQLSQLRDASADTYATDTNDVPLMNEGLQATAGHMTTCRQLLVDEARGWDAGVLEDVKRQRDGLAAMSFMFDRRELYDRDTIPKLERRIASNENKLSVLRGKVEGTVKAGEVERVTAAIIADKETIVSQHARSILIKQTIRDELQTWQSSQYHVSRWNQDWAAERVKYAELHADNWRGLVDSVESMPGGE